MDVSASQAFAILDVLGFGRETVYWLGRPTLIRELLRQADDLPPLARQVRLRYLTRGGVWWPRWTTGTLLQLLRKRMRSCR